VNFSEEWGVRSEEKNQASGATDRPESSASGEGASPPHSSLLTPHSSLPPKGALLGIDYGTKRIGLAVCDPDRLIASPLGTQPNYTGKEAFFRELVARSKFVGIVVGLPLHSNGDESDMSRQARAFARWLAEITGLPVVMWDERCTSAAAEDALLEAKLTKKKRKARVDRVAAQMILQSYLDARCPAGGTNALLGPLEAGPDADDTSN
jgi:putative Holliday junction resolvase